MPGGTACAASGVASQREATHHNAPRTPVLAKAEGRRAAMLEQERPNIFTSSVANIAPGEEVQIEIEYQQALRYDQGRYSLRFPMVVGPRYFPAAEAKGSDAARITTAVFRPADDGVVRNPVTLRVDVQAGVPVADRLLAYWTPGRPSPKSQAKWPSWAMIIMPGPFITWV